MISNYEYFITKTREAVTVSPKLFFLASVIIYSSNFEASPSRSEADYICFSDCVMSLFNTEIQLSIQIYSVVHHLGDAADLGSVN